MAWNSNLLLKREQEEIELGGFGRLPIVEGLQVIETKNKKTFKNKNLIENRRITEDVDATEDVLDKNEDFKSLNFEALFFKKRDKNGNTHENPLEKGHNKETEGEEIEHNESETIDNIGNLSLSAGQNTTVNAPIESIVNATVESTVIVVDVLPQICVRAKGS
nr:hypothetical protein [Tanacetum cinerariifolium]